MIYLDNAATTLHKPPQVIDAVVRAMTTMGNTARAIYDTRRRVARLFGCPRADHVIFTCNATEALNAAILGCLSPGDHVIATDLEHDSVLRPLYCLEEERGVTLSFVPADRQGRLDPAGFEALIRPETRAIVCTHASNLTGNLVDLAWVGGIARRHGLLFLADVAQTAGAVPIHMEHMNIDVLCFTGHKGLMGPQGTGGLCLRPGVELRPWKVGGSGEQSCRRSQPEEYPTRLEAGTLNSHGILGLSAALDFLDETGVENIAQRERILTERFYQGVVSLPQVTVYGDFTQPRRAAIVALNIGAVDSGQISDLLRQKYHIVTCPGTHCAPRMHQALGTAQQGAVRFSFSWYNTEEEVDAAVRAVRELSSN